MLVIIDLFLLSAGGYVQGDQNCDTNHDGEVEMLEPRAGPSQRKNAYSFIDSEVIELSDTEPDSEDANTSLAEYIEQEGSSGTCNSWSGSNFAEQLVPVFV
jgi:hypothetical protein